MTAVLFTCAGQRVDIVSAFGRAGATTIATDLGRGSRPSEGSSAASPRWTGAVFMKFARAPTTKQMRADTRRSHSPLGDHPARLDPE